MVKDMTTTQYTVLLKIPEAATDQFRSSIQQTLTSIDGASAELPEEVTALGLNKKELLLTTVVGFTASIGANFTTDAIKDLLQDKLHEEPSTQQVTVKDVIMEPSTDGSVQSAGDCK